MKSFISVLFLLGVLSAAAQTNREPKLAIHLRSDKPSFSLRDEIHLEIQRENIGVSNLLVPRSWGWGVAKTHIRALDSSGKEVTTGFLADELPPPPKPNDYVLLGPQEFVGIRLDEAATHLVNRVGDYEFFVEYRSYLSEDYARKAMNLPNESFWSRERGTVVSNRIKIRITD